MFGYEDISLNLAYPAVYFILGLILIACYAFYVYKFTIPPVNKFFKLLLISLRTLALLIILFIFFEPALSFTEKLILDPVNLFFFDNSRSVNIDDGSKRRENAVQILEEVTGSPLSNEDEYYLFGENIREIKKDSLYKYNFNDAVTNISDIFSFINKEEKNIASLVFITDGVITSGSNSLINAKKLGLRIFTIGLGDTSRIIDISVKRILHNELLYAESPTTIEATIQQSGLSGKNVVLSLFEEDKLVEQKNIKLNENGIQNENFKYIPLTSGEKKLSIEVSHLSNELSYSNNRKIFYVNVLSNKIKVMLLAGSPSSDLTFIKNVLMLNDNLDVKSLTSITADKFAETSSARFIDSADIFFLIGFPSVETSNGLLNQVVNRFSNDNISFFILVSDYTDFNRIKSLEAALPFNVRNSFAGSREVLLQILERQKNNPIIQNNALNIIEAWNDLPPVFQPPVDFITKPGTDLIAVSRINNNVTNSPILISSNFGGRRSIAVLASNIWKWKLQTVRDKNYLFNNFIINSLKWLNASDVNKRVSIKSLKKNYSLDEMVEFSAQVYNESLNPVSDADIIIKITSESNNYELNLEQRGNGLYEGGIRINTKDDYKYSGEVRLGDELLGTDNGIFNVGDMDIEMINPKMDFEFLNLIANESKGSFAFANNYKELLRQVKTVNNKAIREKFNNSDFPLWSDEWLMVIVILLFSLEWFLRKRAGML